LHNEELHDQTSHQMLLVWSNYGIWDFSGMWHAWKWREMHTDFGWKAWNKNHHLEDL